MIVFIKDVMNFINNNSLLIVISEIVIIFVVTSFLHVVTNNLVKYLPVLLQKYYKKLNQNLLNIFLFSIHDPCIFLLWSIAVVLVLEIIVKKTLFLAKFLLFILSITWVILKFLAEGEKYLINFVYVGDQKAYRRNKTTIIAINRILKVILVLFAVLLTMQYFNINITGIIALGGAGTIVLGLAAKELLANFFGGMMIFMDRQFMVGDSIRSSSQGIEGKVEYIGWRLTRIRTLENSLLYVPNSAFLTMSVENASKRYSRRIKEVIRLKYKDLSKIDTVLEDLRNMLITHPEIDPNQMCFIGIYQFNYLAVDCLLCCFTKATDLDAYLKVQHDILYKISNILNKHEIELAFTTIVEGYKAQAGTGSFSDGDF